MGEEGELAAEKHVRYIVTAEKVSNHPPNPYPLSDANRLRRQLIRPPRRFPQKKDSFESLVMEHLRASGAYWGLTTLDLLHKLHAVDAAEVVDWIMSCYHPESGTMTAGESLGFIDSDLRFLNDSVVSFLGMWLCRWVRGERGARPACPLHAQRRAGPLPLRSARCS